MNKDDLLNLLDLKTTDSPLSEDDLTTSISPTPPRSECRTALHVDDWGRRRGRDLLLESERLRGMEFDEHAVADFHTAAFDPEPTLQDGCSDAARFAFLKQLLQTPDYRGLHATTMLDPVAAGIAAAAFAEQFHASRKEQPPTCDPAAEEMMALRTASRAVIQAREEVGELRDAQAALGLGAGLPGSNDPEAIARLYRRVRQSPTLRRICTLAGRFRRVAQSWQRQKTIHGQDDMVGVTIDGDLSRLLPSELVKLAIPEMELDTLRRIAERQAMCREWRGVEPVGKGPIVVVVDESGSMEGERVETAKALALALAWIARQQRRWCGLIAYSGNSGERLLPLSPGRWDENVLCDWLSEFLGGGSNLDVPIVELPEYYSRIGAPRGSTDLILLTDAACRIPDEERDTFNAWKQAVQVRVITLVIQNEPGDLLGVSDEVHLVDKLQAEGDAVGRILSI